VCQYLYICTSNASKASKADCSNYCVPGDLATEAELAPLRTSVTCFSLQSVLSADRVGLRTHPDMSSLIRAPPPLFRIRKGKNVKGANTCPCSSDRVGTRRLQLLRRQHLYFCTSKASKLSTWYVIRWAFWKVCPSAGLDGRHA
jgi:hypothetical protein